ncbi:hypothetical protein F6B41_10430 [Microbacterium lushaniae]|nr:hypothetical protein F6B41_14475 [Microbacterium lushaniae]KAA9155447.1 hypothetical protein F6B41_10430 [Microbacterium lushaniae]
MVSADPDSTRAADILQARLEDRRMSRLNKAVRVVSSYAIALVSGGTDELLPGMDLVVTRIDTGAEVLRVDAGQPQEADNMLQATRRDLDEMSVSQFVAAWRPAD